MQEILQNAFQGFKVTFTIYFPDSILARVHYVVRIDPKNRPVYDYKEVEKQLIEIGRSWKDGLRENLLEYFGEEKGNQLISRYGRAFPAGYREVFLSRSAVYDIEHIEKLTENHQLEMSFYRPLGAPESAIRFKLYHLDTTIPLSDALPKLENMGLRVIGEQPYAISLTKGTKVWINDFSMVYGKNIPFEVETVKELFQEAFNTIWYGEAENDSFNHLVLEAQLSWREISVLRAYAKYFRQIGFTFSQPYIQETFCANPEVAKLLIAFFRLRFDPELQHGAKTKLQILEKQIDEALEKVAHLDQDRILRQYRDVIQATLRTNYFQTTKKGEIKQYLSFKIDPSLVPGVPLPLPKF